MYTVITYILLSTGNAEDFEMIAENYKNSEPGFDKSTSTQYFALYLSKLNNNEQIKKGIDYMIEYRNQIPKQYRGQVEEILKSGFEKNIQAKGKEIEDYINAAYK